MSDDSLKKEQGITTVVSKPPSFTRVVIKEIKRDKFALISVFVITFLFLFVYIAANFVPQQSTVKVNLKLKSKPPSKEFILGTDPAGRSMMDQLIVGARNSFTIAICVTLICGVIGIIIGLFAGYYGGNVDNTIMRVLDFYLMLPDLMIIIVFVSLVPKYNVFTFVMIMSAFLWAGKTRLFRAKALQQSSLDYVSAAKTLGTPNWKIMYFQVLPNIASIVIANLTLSLAANMGLETGLSFLGFGLPFGTPSLGTLLTYASVPENMQLRPWQWLPAALLILVMMLCINFIGQAVKRAADAKQRLG